MNQEELDKEGITKDILENINIKKLGNPVQLLPNDEPVNLLACAKGFWVLINGEIIKDEANDFMVISKEVALIARARYLVNFKDQVKKEQGEIYEKHLATSIENEVQRLKALTKAKVDSFLSETKFVLQLNGLVEKDFISNLKELSLKENGSLNEYANLAKEIASQEGFLKTYETISQWYKEEEYGNLYSFFFQNGTYEIASFDEKDMDTMIKFFHRTKIQETIDEVAQSSHLANVARFNIEKKLKQAHE